MYCIYILWNICCEIYAMFDIWRVLLSWSQHKGSNIPFLRSLVVNDKGWSQTWLSFMIWVSFSALTLLVGRQERRLAFKQPLILKVLFQNKWKKNEGLTRFTGSPRKRPLNRCCLIHGSKIWLTKVEHEVKFDGTKMYTIRQICQCTMKQI